MKITWNLKSRITLYWLVGLAAVLYLLVFPRPYVGFFNDDVLCIVAAKSLLTGRYVHLQLPTQPPLDDPLPGYPLFLTPFVKLVAPHWSLLKLTSFALTLFSSILLWKLFENDFQPSLRLLLVALFVFNPAVANFSRVVMSEPCFLFFTLWAFIILQRLLNHTSSPMAWILGFILGWASLIRPQGAVLIISVALGLAYAHHWSSLWRVLSAALTIWLLVILRNAYVARELSGYSTLWLPSLLQISGRYDVWVSRCGIIIKTIISRDLLDLSLFVPPSILDRIDVLITLGGSSLMALGLLKCSQSKRSQPLILSMFVFCFLYVLVHSLWVAVDARYFLPLVPLAIACVLQGALVINDWWKPPAWLWLCLATFVIGSYSLRDAVLVYQTYSQSDPERRDLPARTLQWIENNTSPDAKIFTNKNLLVYLYTNRFTFSIDSEEDREMLRYWLLSDGIEYAMFAPEPLLNVHKAWQWKNAEKWISSSPEAFKLLYANSQENTTIFSVLPDHSFTRAYDLYLAAVADFRDSSQTQGLARLDQALKVYPNFAKALNAYGATCLLMNQDLGLARERLTKAIEVDPDFSLAMINLARLYRQTGHPDLAAHYYQEAAKHIQQSENNSLLITIK